MRILVTGGAGYIGSHIVLNLLNMGNNVDVIDSFCNSNPESLKRVKFLKSKRSNSKIKLFEGDIRNSKLLENIFENSYKEKEPIEAVIHLAGLKSVSESIKFPNKYWDINLNGSKTLLSIMDRFKCNNIVFSSSATVYNCANQKDLLNENSNIKPINPYGATKVAVEDELARLYKKDKKWRISILRYFNPIGAHSSGLLGEDPFGIPNNLFPLILKVGLGEIDSLRIFGNDWPTNDGTPIRDYIHVMDLAEAHMLALEKIMEFKSKFLVLNIGTGIGSSVLDLINTFEKVNNCKLDYVFDKRRKGDFPFVVSDNTFALKILGWEPKRNLEDMCRDGWNWIMKNPKGYNKIN